MRDLEEVTNKPETFREYNSRVGFTPLGEGTRLYSQLKNAYAAGQQSMLATTGADSDEKL